ncbi:MAG: hypothetical protein H0S82_07710, partial [Anaerolineaceae bacterium]|nr:hypothetical protein [Anaerolineaceae bacterium]
MPTRKQIILPLLILLLLIGTACQSNWTIAINENADATGTITCENVDFYIENSDEEIETVPLGQFLYDSGYRLIDQITLVSKDNESVTYIWDEIAEEAAISPDGTLTIGESV